MESKISIISVSDANYALPMATMLSSALTHLSEDTGVDLYLVDAGLGNRNKERLLRAVNALHSEAQIHWVVPDVTPVKNLRTMRHLNYTTYIRLLLADFVPADCRKVLCMDGDMLVLDDLTALWRMPMNGAPILAAQDFYNPYADGQFGIAKHVELGISPKARYFNSGLMVVDMDAWRREEIISKATAYFAKYAEFQNCHDQEALNVIFSGRWGSLPPRWNYMMNPGPEYIKGMPDSETRRQLLQESESGSLRPALLHFAGVKKPWDLSKQHPEMFRFFRYLFGCEFFDETEMSLMRKIVGAGS